MSVYVPKHLLKFTGDPEMELHYRYVLYSYGHDNKTTDPNQCLACNAQLPQPDRTRLKPPQKMTKNIQKLLSKKSRQRPLSKIETFKLNKFMNSSQQMVVRCSRCGLVNKKPTIDKRTLIKQKNTLISEVEATNRRESGKIEKGSVPVAENEAMEVTMVCDKMEMNGNEGKMAIENDPSVVEEKKRKKKKKKNKNENAFMSTLIQQKALEKKALKRKLDSTPTPVSLRNFIESETKDTPSSSSSSSSSKTPMDISLNIFRKSVLGDPSYNNQTPTVTESTPKTLPPKSASTMSASSKKSKKKSKSDKELRQSLFFETPASGVNKSMIQTPTSSRPTLKTQQQLSATTPSSKKARKKAMKKELKNFLNDTPQMKQTSSSLKDFLISL